METSVSWDREYHTRTSSVPRRLNIAGRVAVLREERTGLLTGEGFEWHSRKPVVEKSSWI